LRESAPEKPVLHRDAAQDADRHGSLPMGMVKMIVYGLILLPVAEIAAFLIVAGLIGFVKTIMLLAVISLAGIIVLRRQTGTTAPRSAAGGIDWGAAAGGVLLLLPGFITGLGGLLMLHARSRQWLLRRFANRAVPQRPAPGPQLIELSPKEWKRLPEGKQPHRQRRVER
jgi:UPF0716 protein FxsA